MTLVVQQNPCCYSTTTIAISPSPCLEPKEALLTFVIHPALVLFILSLSSSSHPPSRHHFSDPSAVRSWTLPLLNNYLHSCHSSPLDLALTPRSPRRSLLKAASSLPPSSQAGILPAWGVSPSWLPNDINFTSGDSLARSRARTFEVCG